MKRTRQGSTTQEINARLARLENAVFGRKVEQAPSAQKEIFVGPSGGVRLLIPRRFFKTKRNLGEVKKALAKNDYLYGAAQIQTALNRLSKRAGPLATSKERGKKVYVRRK
jgi:hypothetical protein